MIYIRYIISKKIVLFFLVISIVLSYSAPINAQQADNSNSLASVSDNLNKLGLLSGDGNGNYNLDSNLKRTEAMTFLAKLMGKYEYIQKNRDTLKKTKFKDVAETDWFAPYVGFCYSNNIVSGYGNQLFGSKDNITEQAFLVMVLKLLKYDDIKWNDNVFKKAYEVGLVADKAYLSRTKDNNNSYTRGQAVSSMNTALSTKINGQSKTLIQLLINDGAVNADIAKSLGYDTVEKTETTKDTIAVKINEILVVSNTEIAVNLNTELKSINKNNILIYEAGNKNNILNISSVTSSGTKLIIKTGTQVPGKSYNVELINIKDSKGNILLGLTGSFSGYAQIIMPPAGVVTPPSTPPPAPKPSLAVDSVIAINTNQIQIIFTSSMDKSSVKDISFYEIKDKGTDVISLAQGSVFYDGLKNAAVITLSNNVRLTNHTTAKVTIKKGIKSITGLELADTAEFNVRVEDLIAPTFRSFEVTGDKSLKITFSEPVYDGTNNTLLDINNFDVTLCKPKYFTDTADISFYGSFSYTVQKAELSGDSVTLFFAEDLVEGTMLVNYKIAGTAPIQDYVGNKVPNGGMLFMHAKDGIISFNVTVKKAEENIITLGFSKPVTATDLRLFHTDKNIAANMSTPVSTEKGTFVNEITFEFPNKIPIGTTDLFLVTSTDPSCKTFNIYGQYVQDQTLVAEVVVDNEAPSVTSTFLDGNYRYIIDFNEKVSRSFGENPANYYFYTTNNTEFVSFTPSLSLDKKSIILDIVNRLRDNTEYNLEVRNAEDLYGNKMSSDIKYKFTTGDYVNPTVEEIKCCTINSDGKIIIYFREPMNEAQMLDKSNYMVATTYGAIYTSLGTDDTVTKLSDMSVMIDLVKEVNLPKVKISTITDLAGKSLNNGYLSQLYAIKQDTVNIKSTNLVAKNKVKITFNTRLKTFNKNDISFCGVTECAINLTHVESQIVNDDGNTEIVIGLDKELGTDGTYKGSNIYVVSEAVTNSETLFGTRLSPSQKVKVSDGVPPEVITYDHDSDDLTEPVEKVVLSGDILTSIVDGKVPKDTIGTITISLSEPIYYYYLSISTFAVEGYTVTNISNSVNNSEIVLSIKANSDNTPARTTVTQHNTICDYEGNKLLSDKALKVR